MGAELLLLLRERYGTKAIPKGAESRRTFAKLLAIAEEKQQQRQKKDQQTAAKARKKQLNAIAPQGELLWKVVIELIEQKKSNSYAQAVAHLVDLHDLAELDDEMDTFLERLQEIVDQYHTRSAFLSRLEKAGLIE